MDIGAWLQSLGLEQYEMVFQANAVDTEILLDLSEPDLEKLGVLLGHRKKLLKAIAALRETPATSAADYPSRSEIASEAERRQLTVMFCDLVGSTTLCLRLDPEDLREVITVYHRCVAATVTRFGGFVAKYMGDGVLVYFGYPAAHEDDLERAVSAGLALVGAIGQLPATVEPLQVRVGLATGLVVVGDLIGVGASWEQAVVGETPNLAARLQALAPPNAVVIAQETRRLAGDLFAYEDLGPVEVKGFGTPVSAWRVLAENPVESRSEALHASGGHGASVIGRDEEIKLLLRLWQRAMEGSGQVALISGEPGIGKSRLAATLEEHLASDAHAAQRYFCSSHHQDSAQHPFIAHLERAAGFERNDNPDIKLGKLTAVLSQTSLSEQAPTPIEDIGLLAELLSLAVPGCNPPINRTPQQRKERIFAALLRHLTDLPSHQPILILFEDIHWIDPTSRELLDLIVERVPTFPILLIVTFRPEIPPPWLDQPHVTSLALSRLDQHQGAALVERIAGSGALSAEIVEQIVERTDGVPLFVEELTKAVLEEVGHGHGAPGSLTRSNPEPMIPATLQASLLARLDRLGPAAKHAAQVGATIGREFSYEMLATVADQSAAELRGGLDRLTRAELVFRCGDPPDASFLFKHALVQDVAYSSLLRARRRHLHGAIARMLEERFPERAEAQPELVAHHLTEAGQAEAAVDYWLKAGRRSAGHSADREAVRHLRRGLDLLTNLPASEKRDRLELGFQLALGTPLISLHGWSGSPVAAAYERASSLCDQLGDSEHLAPTLFGLASNRVVRGDVRAALGYAERCRSIGEYTGDRIARLLGHRAMGAALRQLGRLAESRLEFEKIPLLYDAEADRLLAARCITDPRASGLSLLSQVLWVMGFVAQARHTAGEAFDCAARLEHANTSGHIRIHAGAELAEMMRDVRAAREQAETAIALAAEHRMPGWRGYGLVISGWALAWEGRIEEGIERVRQGIRELDALGTAFNRSHHLGLLAELYGRRGDWAAGLQVLEEAYEEVRRTEARFWEADLHRIEGDLLCLSDASTAGAATCFATAIAVAQEQGAKSFELRAATKLAHLWCDQGRSKEARDLLAPVYSWFTESFDTPDLKEAKLQLDKCRRRNVFRFDKHLNSLRQ